jgi:hypothetical protein
MSFINGYVIEINQYPRYGENYTIKDYFYYDSNTKQYGHRDTVIPVEFILNSSEIPEEAVVKAVINNKIPVMKRVIDLNKQKESWIFDTNILKETKNER